MATKKPAVLVEDGAAYIMCPGTKVYLKTADVAAMTGKSNQWIGQLLSQGILHKQETPHGAMFEMSQTVSDYCDMLDSRGSSKTDEEIKDEKSKSKAEMQIKVAKAAVAKAEAAELLGKMHRSEDVEAMTTDLVYTIRGALLALPGRLAVDIVKATTAAEAAKIISVEVNKVMRELAAYQYDPAKYEERVRERRKWETTGDRGDVDE